MSRLKISVLNAGLGAALVFGLSACNRDANADVANTPASAAAPAAEPVAPPPTASEPAGPKYARVVSVDPVREAATAPRRECHDEVVTHRAPVKDQHQIAGTAIGAVAGGLLGNQIGGGKGRTLATVAGAVGGGYAGHEIQQRRQETNTVTSTVRKCSTVPGSGGDKIVAYDVRYEYNGVTRSVRMDHDPGDRVEVQEGVSVVSDAR
ncbi:glycine zipper 2TM domain-containing protein [Luteibacter yeojuensis]|uniref:Glycine zipper 2TM domain-containing protein n=1 Tax=Luteibacter yeojuensis TaxID=345309 RepID=A0A7X5TPG1_9GAMM|nr:glycine zipper 2TM domain-containing protein [Luteibacter yeojuensis]NID14432.1 glycine zipper 2TM domain-containing protein [Luteibacter yeojuensis]